MSFCRPPWARVVILWSEVSERGYWGGRSLAWVSQRLIRDGVRPSAGHWEQKGKEPWGDLRQGDLCEPLSREASSFMFLSLGSGVCCRKGCKQQNLSYLTSSSYK